ncbi:MAG: hypothetical protein ACE5IO_06985 [Thermoplasmata archaeon]
MDREMSLQKQLNELHEIVREYENRRVYSTFSLRCSLETQMIGWVIGILRKSGVGLEAKLIKKYERLTSSAAEFGRHWTRLLSETAKDRKPVLTGDVVSELWNRRKNVETMTVEVRRELAKALGLEYTPGLVAFAELEDNTT